jgi:SAM-dependent methyltransferase
VIDPESAVTHPSLVHLSGGKPSDEGDLILERRAHLVRPFLGRGELLLDFGCGNGAQTLHFRGDFRQILAVDVSPRALRRMNEVLDVRNLSDRVFPTVYDGLHLPLRDRSVEAIVSFEVLEHVHDEERVLKELARVLAPGGRLAMTVPNRWWIFETHGAELPLLRWQRVPFFSWLPKRLHDRWARARNYRRREIVAKLRRAVLQIIESAYVTAPLDALPWAPLRRALRRTLFHADRAVLPPMATAIVVFARKPRR